MSLPVETPGSFDIGRVISRLFGVLGRQFGVFFAAAALLAGLPMLILGILQTFAVGGDGALVAGPVAPVIAALVTLTVTLVSGALLEAAIIHGTVTDLNGGRVSLANCLSTSLRLVLPLIAIVILVGIATFVGLMFFIVPGVLAALALCVAAPAEVVERRGVFESIRRSVELTRNCRAAIFGLMILFFVLSLVIQLAGGAVAASLGVSTPLGFPRATSLIAAPLAQTFTSLIGAAGIASVYYELRNIKEGIGPEALAALFD